MTTRLIPSWTLKDTWQVRKNEQLPSLQMFSLDSIKLFNPCPYEWRPWSDVYDQLVRAGNARHFFPGVECISSMLEQSVSFPEEWKEFTIQLWGTIFRNERGYPVVKAIYFNLENEIWLASNYFVRDGYTQPDESVGGGVIHSYENIRIPYLQQEVPHDQAP